MGYKHLTYLQRCKLQALLDSRRYIQKDIAKELGVNESTISRELDRNMTRMNTRAGCMQYKADHAHFYAQERHKKKHKKIKFDEKVRQFVIVKLQDQWSPEQISGYAKLHNLFDISHEQIYQFILDDKQKGGKLYTHLRHQNKKYRKRYGSPKRQGSIRNRRFIDDRPEVVNMKNRVGDWEIDTIIGKQQKQAVVSMVERVSKKTILKKVKCRTAEQVSMATIEGLKSSLGNVFTITSDNGSEFAYHEKISRELNAEFYFAHPYSSWERGLNENTNGLVRQYIKKGSDFSHVTDEKLLVIMDQLNNRPRKSLGFKTPNEIFNLVK